MAATERVLIDSGTNSTDTSIGGNTAAEFRADGLFTLVVRTDRTCTLSLSKYDSVAASWFEFHSQSVAAAGASLTLTGHYGRCRATLTVGSSSAWNARVFGSGS